MKPDYETLSAEEQENLLDKENELRQLRDQEQRDFLTQQESERVAQEKGQRLLAEQQEKARVAELERLEIEAGDLSSSIQEAPDADSSVANMFAALTYGTGAAPQDTTTEDTSSERPE